MTNKSISWAGCTCDFFSILRNRTMNAKTAQWKMAESPQNCNHQLAYSFRVNLDINRTLSSVCTKVYICVFSFSFKNLLGTFSLSEWILFIKQMDLFHSQHKTVWPIENKTDFAALIQTHSHWTVDTIIFYRPD